MIAEASPALLLIVGAIAVPFLRGVLRWAWALALPVAGLALVIAAPDGDYGAFTYLGVDLVLVRLDALSRVFTIIFLIAALLSVVYAMHVKDWVQPAAGLAYAGSAVGAVLAGDLLTLFVFWELTAATSIFLVWAGGTERARRAGMRYAVIQIASGMLVLIGALAIHAETGSFRFEHIGIGSTGGVLVLLGFGIKCAFPLLHNWLQDAYPEATEVGAVFLSAFTTKLAVYALARGFAGTEELIWIGAVMTAFPIFYAVIENDLRRVLAYSLNNQLGFMVVGVGIGTELALNGTVAHAFCHILYKALLFMSMGAVLLRTGTCKGSELGGLYKSMPWTCAFCIVGAASISAFPLFSGFVSKSLILSAAAGGGWVAVWLVLLFASAGVFHHSGIKIPYFAFFGHDSGIRVKEAPANMLIAMGIAAALCIGIGVFPSALYALLPYPVDYQPYTGSHVLTQLQLLMFSALAFAVLMRTRIYPPELRSTNLDFDWVYRGLGGALVRALDTGSANGWDRLRGRAVNAALRFVGGIQRHHGPQGVLARSWPTGSMALWATLLLGACVVIYYV